MSFWKSPRPEGLGLMRAKSGVIAFVFIAALAAALLIDSAVRGRLDIVSASAPWVAVVLWALWVLAVRPLIAYDSERVTVVNIFRRHSFPWSRVRGITDLHQIVFTLDDDRVIKCWGGPVKARPRRPRMFSGEKIDLSPHTPLDELERVRAQARVAAGGPGAEANAIRSEWEILPLALGAAAVLWLLLSLAL